MFKIYSVYLSIIVSVSVFNQAFGQVDSCYIGVCEVDREYGDPIPFQIAYIPDGRGADIATKGLYSLGDEEPWIEAEFIKQNGDTLIYLTPYGGLGKALSIELHLILLEDVGGDTLQIQLATNFGDPILFKLVKLEKKVITIRLTQLDWLRQSSE